MKTYKFPQISHISDVLPHIEGRDEFKVIEKDWYVVVNYVVAFEDTFPSMEVNGGSKKSREETLHHNSILRECRGLVFHKRSGELLSRPYHKFFNVGEKTETHPNRFADLLSSSHTILEKLDGSMVRPIRVPGVETYGGFRLGTKAGVTDIALQAETWVASRPHYCSFIHHAISEGLTPIFEWCSRKNRIVIDYPEDRLVLTAIRHNLTGNYLSYTEMWEYGKSFSLDVVKSALGTEFTIDELVGLVSQWKGEEGVVVRWGDGHMAKIKAADYLTLHRSKSALANEKNVIEVIVNDQLDDLIPILTESDASRLRAFQKAFWVGLDDVASNMVDTYLDEGGPAYADQRAFATEFVSTLPPHLRPFMYGLRKGRGMRDMLIDYVKKSLISRTKLEKARWAWGLAHWTQA